MNYTNKMNLPKVFVDYYNSNEKREIKEFRYSVTELLGSTKEIVLKRKFQNELEEDISECIPALLGTSVHEWLEKNNNEDGDEKELKFELRIGEFTIVGIIDVLNRKLKLIKDYKTCSVSKIQKQDFDDWYKQGMIYAYAVWNLFNVKIEKLEFLAMMKDWSKLKSFKVSNYPSNPIYIWEYNIKDSDFIEIEKFVKLKLNEIYNYSGQDCSLEEKWYTGDKYAVYKNGSEAKAKIVCDTLEEAQDYLSNKLNEDGIIQKRIGDNLKCLYYCPLKNICYEEK